MDHSGFLRTQTQTRSSMHLSAHVRRRINPGTREQQQVIEMTALKEQHAESEVQLWRFLLAGKLKLPQLESMASCSEANEEGTHVTSLMR